ADGIIAVSESTRQDTIRVLGISPEKITVIHSGVAEAFFSVTTGDAATARAEHGLNKPYVLFLGTIEPRKNIAALLDAWSTLQRDIRQEFELVLAGPPGWAAPELMARLANPPPGIRYLGYIAEKRLAGLTAGATVFVYPSLYEGFGFPVAQAM